MEPEREDSAEGASGCLREFLSRFATACRDAGGPGEPPQAARAPHETRRLLVRILGGVLFHCSAHLSQWRATNPPGIDGEQVLPSPARQGYLYLLSLADYAAGELWRVESSAAGRSTQASPPPPSSAGLISGLWHDIARDATQDLNHGLTAFVISVLEGGIALQLSPADVNVAVRIVERLALQAPPASLGYGGGDGGGGKVAGWSGADWPSAPVPAIADDAFGFQGDTATLLRAAMTQHFGDGAWGAAGSVGAAAAAAGAVNEDEDARRLAPGATGDAGVSFADWPGRGSPHPGLGVRTGAMAAIGAAEGKPSLCLVAGDALGARLLGWCTVACRSPQWREFFSGREAKSSFASAQEAEPASNATSRAVASTKRTVDERGAEGQEAEVSPASPTADNDPMDQDEDDGEDGGDGEFGGGDAKAALGLAQLLCLVTRVVRALKEHTKALEAMQERASGIGFFAGLASGAPCFDLRSRESSGVAQALVSALADAIFGVFVDHMADPALHRQLRSDGRATGAAEGPTPGGFRGGGAAALAEIVPLVDGPLPDEMVGLSVELLSDIAWLFSSLEPEAGGALGGDGGSATKVGPAAAVLSSAMCCWASGRLLACMPGREQLEHALGLPSLAGGGGGESAAAAAVEGGDASLHAASAAAASPPTVRPLPARLACFAVRTLLENVQVAREKLGEAAESLAPLAQTEESTPALACAARSTAFYRVALITEQMPAWRERRQWSERRRRRQSIGELSAAGDTEEALRDDEVAAAAAPAAAVELLDVLVALVCSAAEHERLGTARRGQAEAAGGQRRPTMYTVGSIGNLMGPALAAISELVSPGSSGLRPHGGGGGAASTRSSMLARGKKRRALTPGGSGAGSGGSSGSAGSAVASLSTAAEARWGALVGLQLTASLDRVHLAGMLLAWEPWHPWMDKTAPSAALAATTSATGRASPLSLRHSRSWQTFWALASQLAQACVSPRPPPPPAQELAALVTQTVVAYGAGGEGGGSPAPFLDMPAVLLLGKLLEYNAHLANQITAGLRRRAAQMASHPKSWCLGRRCCQRLTARLVSRVGSCDCQKLQAQFAEPDVQAILDNKKSGAPSRRGRSSCACGGSLA